MYNIWCRITKSSLQLVLHEGLLGTASLKITKFIIYFIYRNNIDCTNVYICTYCRKAFPYRKVLLHSFFLSFTLYIRNAPVHSETVLATSKRLLLFLIVPAFCWSWGFVDRGVQIVDHNKSSKYFYLYDTC